MNKSKQYITISAEEKREWVLINEPYVDLHIVQEVNSSLLLHVIALPKLTDSDDTQGVNITVEHVGKGCRTEIVRQFLFWKFLQITRNFSVFLFITPLCC